MDNPAEGGLSSIVNLRKKRARKSFKGTMAGNSLLFYVALCNRAQARAFMDYVEKWKGKANARENGGKNWREKRRELALRVPSSHTGSRYLHFTVLSILQLGTCRLWLLNSKISKSAFSQKTINKYFWLRKIAKN